MNAVFANVVCFFHKEEQEDHGTSAENTGPVEDPSPTLVLGDEAADNWRKVVTAGQEKGVKSHVSSTLVGEVLSLSVNSCDVERDERPTTSVTVISGRASMGAVKKPWTMQRAIHWP